MSIKESAIRLVLKARDTLSRPVRRSSASLEKFRSEARQLKNKLTELSNQDKLLASFKQQIQSVRQANLDYAAARNKVEKLAVAYKKADKPTQQLEKQLRAARRAASDTSAAYQKQRARLEALRGILTKAGLSHKHLSAQQKKLKGEITQTSKAFEQFDQKARRAATALKQTAFKKVAKDAEKASGSIQRLSGRFAALIGATVGLYGLKRAVTGLLNTGDQFERLRVQLNAIMGSLEGGEKAIEWIKQFTRDTPYQLEQVAESFVRLKAFGLDPMDGTMQAIVDQASKLGGGMERLNGITLAVGQAWAKQKLQGEEILQLVERGVPVWSLLEKATGKNVQELQKLSTAGKLGQETIKLLINEIGKSASGAAAENMSLLSGYVSNLKDSWKNFLDEIAQSGALEYAKAQLKAIAEQITRMSEDGRLFRLAQSISDAFVQMGEAIKANFAGITFDDVVARVKSTSDAISQTLAGLNQSFTMTGNGLKLFFNGFTIAVKSFGLAVSAAFAQIANGASELFSFLNADELVAKTKRVQASLQATSDQFAEQVKQDAKDIQAAFRGIVEGFTDSNQQTQQAIREESQKTTKNIAQDQGELQENLTATQQAMTGLQEKTEQVTEATEKYSKATKETASKQEAMSEAAGSVAATLANYYTRLTDELGQMSNAAVQAFESVQGVDQSTTGNAQDDIASLKDQLEAAQAEAQRLSETISADPTGIDSWLTKTGANAAYIKAQFLEQKIAFTELMEAYEQGQITMEGFISQGKTAASTMNLLDQQSLDQLNRSIQQAEASMERLVDSSQSTLESLQNELDRLQGKNEQIEQRQYQARQRQLQTELEEAKSSGDSTAQQNLQKALNLNSQIYDERRRQSAQQKREERKAQPAIQAPQQPPKQKTMPDKVIRLDYPGGNINVGINPRDEIKLLDMLKYAGMRSV